MDVHDATGEVVRDSQQLQESRHANQLSTNLAALIEDGTLYSSRSGNDRRSKTAVGTPDWRARFSP